MSAILGIWLNLSKLGLATNVNYAVSVNFGTLFNR